MTQRELLDILAVAERLKHTTRHSVAGDGRWESVAEHSWRAALMALLMQDELGDIDINKVIKMCLVHDLGEAFTGDIPAFLKTAEDGEREEDLLRRWLASMPSNVRENMEALFDEMARMESGEARAYKAIDKLEALIQHNEAGRETWLPLEDELQLTYGIKECQCRPYLRGLRQLVKEDSQRLIDEGTGKAGI